MTTLPEPHQLDEETNIFFIQVPGSKVALLQALFESYEGLGTVRTIDIRKSLICILLPNSMVETCLKVLEDIQQTIQWTPIEGKIEYSGMTF